MGGEFVIETEKGSGTRVTLQLPLKEMDKFLAKEL
jgi:chemotaxis protein histidine kinase CheA